MIAQRIALAFLALVIGGVGFVLLFLIGEGTGSGLLAYAADTLLFALAAFVFTRTQPAWWLAYALLLCGPVFLISIAGAGGGGGLLAVLMTAITVGVGFLVWVQTSDGVTAPPADTDGQAPP